MQQTPITPSPLADEKREALDALVQGPDAWDRYRLTHPGPVDLSGLDIGTAIRDRYGLRDDQDVYLPRFDMSQVNLSGAKLRRCMLDASNFRLADLTEADLTMSSIVGADFDGAVLNGTFMLMAKCYRSRFPYGALRNANLFMEPGWQLPATSDDPFIDEIVSLTDLIAKLRTLEPMMESMVPGVRTRLFYRGHDDSTWTLKPSIMRLESIGNAESEVLTDFMARNPDVFADRESLLSQTVRAREYGLPTRLLDITSNPLVAMFFAVNDERLDSKSGALHVFGLSPWMIKSFNSDTIALVCAYARLNIQDQRMLTGVYDPTSSDAESHIRDARLDHLLGRYNFRWSETMDRLLGEVIMDRHHFSNRIDPFDFFKVFAVTPKAELRRLREQSGAFLLSGFHQRFERNVVLRAMPNTPIYEHRVFTIPADAKRRIREELERLNISKETMLSSPEVSAEAIRKRYGFE